MVSSSFTGYVERLFPPDDYRQEIVVSTYDGIAGKEQALADIKNRKSGTEYPMALTFVAGVKSGAYHQFDGICEGDYVEVKFYIVGKTGISKKGNYYHLNELTIQKKDGIKVLRKSVAAPGSEDVDGESDAADMPF